MGVVGLHLGFYCGDQFAGLGFLVFGEGDGQLQGGMSGVFGSFGDDICCVGAVVAGESDEGFQRCCLVAGDEFADLRVLGVPQVSEDFGVVGGGEGFDSVGGAMVEVQENIAMLGDADREAIAAYLKAVPPRPNGYKVRGRAANE